MFTTCSNKTDTVHHGRAQKFRGVALTAMAVLLLAACSKSTNSSSTTTAAAGGSSGSSGGSASAASSNPATWSKTYCNSLDTAVKGIKAEQASYNAAPNAPDNAGQQGQEVAHLNKYLSIVGTEVAQLQSGGSPSVPAGPSFVSGMLKAWQTFQSAVQSNITTTNGLDPTSDTFGSDLSNVTDAVNTAFQTLSSDMGSAVSDVNNASNPGNNPMIQAINASAACTDASS